MLFNSYEFMLAFLPVFIIGYFLIRHFYREDEKLMRLCNLWIIAGSLVFYAFFGVKNVLVLLVSIMINTVFISVLNFPVINLFVFFFKFCSNIFV